MGELASFLNHIYVVILCGGGGTRVWPLSVKKKPKQFLNFYSEKTLYQETIERAKQLVPAERILVVTNAKYVDEIKSQSPEIPSQNIIGEPEKKNTAMAMGVAAAYIYHQDKDAVIINFASDHVISNLDVYQKTLKVAAEVAYESKQLVSVGVQPTYPHPGFGYIHLGKELEKKDGLSISVVEGFREKPDVETAKQFLETGEYLWNANNYIWRADSILAAFDKLAPQIAKQIHLIEKSIGTPKEKATIGVAYAAAPEEPIDTAISEKTKDLLVLPGQFGWHDIGSWEVVYQLGKKDSDDNVIIHSNDVDEKVPVMLFESSGNLVYANNQPIGLIGITNAVVIDTGFGLLICDKTKTNQVKKIVETLEKEGLVKYL